MISAFTNLINSALFGRIVSKAIVLLICFPVHECAHAWTAAKLGDPTGERAGRVTLNPAAHLDLWGTVMFLALGMGYAKPVRVSASNLRKARRDRAIIAAAGPLSNLVMAMIFLLADNCIYALTASSSGYGPAIACLSYCLRYVSFINLTLAVFNFVPIPPLDGYHILSAFMRGGTGPVVAWLERNSMYAILGLFSVCIVLGITPVSTVSSRLVRTIDSVFSRLITV